MFFEILLCCLLLLTIFVFFYRQAVHEFTILQVDSLEKAFASLSDLSPIVVYPYETNLSVWTRKALKQQPALYKTLEASLEEKESVPMSSGDATQLAERVGLDVLTKKSLLEPFRESKKLGFAYWTKTEALIGAQGLRPTYAYTTFLQCSEGALSVQLVTEASDEFFPPDWRGKRLAKLTRDEAPLVGQIQFVDVILRPGSLLCIPPHWRVSYETKVEEGEKGSALAVWTELHHPMSALFAHVAKQRE